MKEKDINIRYLEFDSINQLSPERKLLVEKAIDAIKSSYAPYSNFNVGAAVRMSNGETVTGSNQENAASPSGLCAERVALFSAHHKFPDCSVEAIAVIAAQNGKLTEDFTYPCAACLQVLAESEKRSGKSIEIIIGSATKIQIMESVGITLPFAFSNLK